MVFHLVDDAIRAQKPTRDEIRRLIEHMRWWAKRIKEYSFVSDYDRQRAFNAIQPSYKQIMEFAQSGAQTAPEGLLYGIYRAQYRLDFAVLQARAMQYMRMQARSRSAYQAEEGLPFVLAKISKWILAYDAGDVDHSQWFDAFKLDVELEKVISFDQEYTEYRRSARIIPLPQV